MTGPGSGSEAARESDWERRKRLAEVFGDTLPDTTSDERDERDGTAPEKQAGAEPPGDRWLREQVPPHHGS